MEIYMTAVINAKQVLKTYGIKEGSVVRAIQQVGEDIGLSSDPLAYANSIISDLGGTDQYDLASARIIAKALVEQAMTQEEYDRPEAVVIADTKLDKIRKDMPYVFAESEASEDQPSTTTRKVKIKSVKTNDKKPKAKAIFDANKDKTNGEIAQMIAAELEITYANAYYYVSRVFKR
jgi:hypothetical protein